MSKMSFLLVAVATLLIGIQPVDAQAQFGQLYYEGEIVRTVVPPAASPQAGRDNLYAIMGGVADQLAVIAVAPGDRGYHGGQWAFHRVDWAVAPYLLTSDDAVLAAEAAGDLTITRVPGNDFKCPVQP